MALELHMHPLSSYCWKVLIALYETGTPFTPVILDLQDPAVRAEHLKSSPFGKIPALRDTSRKADVFETSVIIEYLDTRYPGPAPLIPADPDAALETRLIDRVFDLYLHAGVQSLVADRLRPPGRRDAAGVDEAREGIRRAYAVLEHRLAGRSWAAGDSFGLADCAAAPALFYADVIEPLGAAHPSMAAYFKRLSERPSVARVMREARPYFHMFPALPIERARLPSA